MVRKIINFFTWPVRKIQEEIKFRRRIKEIKKRDPFIYK